ncbi:MAG: hypothetical protein Q9187_002363 [Circinaria calcarea]
MSTATNGKSVSSAHVLKRETMQTHPKRDRRGGKRLTADEKCIILRIPHRIIGPQLERFRHIHHRRPQLAPPDVKMTQLPHQRRILRIRHQPARQRPATINHARAQLRRRQRPHVQEHGAQVHILRVLDIQRLYVLALAAVHVALELTVIRVRADDGRAAVVGHFLGQGYVVAVPDGAEDALDLVRVDVVEEGFIGGVGEGGAGHGVIKEAGHACDEAGHFRVAESAVVDYVVAVHDAVGGS